MCPQGVHVVVLDDWFQINGRGYSGWYSWPEVSIDCSKTDRKLRSQRHHVGSNQRNRRIDDGLTESTGVSTGQWPPSRSVTLVESSRRSLDRMLRVESISSMIRVWWEWLFSRHVISSKLILPCWAKARVIHSFEWKVKISSWILFIVCACLV